jgi:DUF1680 family protein
MSVSHVPSGTVPSGTGPPTRPAARRSCTRIAGTEFAMRGVIGDYLRAVSEQWLKPAPFSNPAMLDMFRDRDREPKRELMPWSGEFAGKYLTSAVQVLRLTADPELRRLIADFVARFCALQDDDGYLGPWPRENRLTGEAPNVRLRLGNEEWDAYRKTWDAQGHYHSMLGLLLWFEETGDETALTTARRIGDLLCDVAEHRSLVDFDLEGTETVMNVTEMNQAPIHSLCLLHEDTGEERYLHLAVKIRDEFAATAPNGEPVAGDYLGGPLSGKEFFELPKPRWESLYPVLGLAGLAAITGDQGSRRAFESMWWSILGSDRRNNGGFSSWERAVGNPYDKTGIETCCTIAWMAMSVEMLRLTRDSLVADELELSTFNSAIGMHAPNGRWVTYDTPMDGVRRSSTDFDAFQSREGSPELTCCSAHGARSLGMLSDWALMAADDGVVLNWYGPGSMRIPSYGGLTLVQETDYPRGDAVRLTIYLDRARSFVLHLRIPGWSEGTQVRVNGEPVDDVEPGTYLALDRLWRWGDVIDITFDFALQYWVGERDYEGKVSIYRGPILLTYDRRFNSVDPDQIPTLDARGLSGDLVASDHWIPPTLLMEFTSTDGQVLRLCDFGSAGAGGSPYRSWLDVDSCVATEFSRSAPRRSAKNIDTKSGDQ